jgi:hypothetical protein
VGGVCLGEVGKICMSMKNLLKFICVSVFPQIILFGQVSNKIDSTINYDNDTKLFYSKSSDSLIYGTYIWPNGDKYSGQFINGKRTGIGTYIWSNKDKYSGEFFDGIRNGYGRYEWNNGAIFEGKWKLGKEIEGIYYYKNGTTKKITNTPNFQISTNDTLVRIENLIQFEKGIFSKCYSNPISNYLVLVSDENEVIVFDVILRKIISKMNFDFSVDVVHFNPYNLSEITLISDRAIRIISIHKNVIINSKNTNFKVNSLFFIDSTNFIYSGDNNRVQYSNGKIICKGDLASINQLLKGQGSLFAFQEVPLKDDINSNEDYYNKISIYDSLTKSLINSFSANVDVNNSTNIYFGDYEKSLFYVNLRELMLFNLDKKEIKSILQLESNILSFAINNGYILCSTSKGLYVCNRLNNEVRLFDHRDLLNIKIISNNLAILISSKDLIYINLMDLHTLESIKIKSDDKSSLHGILDSEIQFSRFNSNFCFNLLEQQLKPEKISAVSDLSKLTKGLFNFHNKRYFNSGFGKKSETYIMSKRDLNFLYTAIGINKDDVVKGKFSFCQLKNLMAYIVNDNLFVYNIEINKLIFSYKLNLEEVCIESISLEFSINGKYLMLNSFDCGIYIIEIESRKFKKICNENMNIECFWTQNEDFIIACSPSIDSELGEIKIFNVESSKLTFAEESLTFTGASIIDSVNLLFVYNDSIKIVNLTQNSADIIQPLVYKTNFYATWNNKYFIEYDKEFSKISFYKAITLEFLGNYNFQSEIKNVVFWSHDIILLELKNEFVFFDLTNKLEILRLQFLSRMNYMLTIPNSPYYMCSKDASKMLHYVTPSLKVIGFEQLDPVYNRPDIVLDSIGMYFGNSDGGMIEEYRKSWEKRIDRLGLDKEKLGKGEIAVPNAEIVGADAIAYDSKNGKVDIKVAANDPKYPLRRFNVYVNEVPLYGSAGISIAHLKKQVWDTTVSVPLSMGENKIQVSVMNELGLENFKYPSYVNYTPSEPIVAKTYYIGIGVNEFMESSHNLKYCVKDVTDLSTSFGGPNTEVKLFTNAQVTKENILALKDYLSKTTVNDKVIISCSSHGLLDDSSNFYLATHDVDFNNPKERGLKYEALENLLDGIPARQKLLLLDACNSGENDKTEVFKNELANNHNNMDSTQILAARGVIIKLEDENKSNFKKMNELFVNVRNNTGSVIISAAGGQESALEAITVDRKSIENGAFSYCVLEYLKNNSNKPEELTVNKLKNYVEKRVEEITNGKQQPTSRQETMEIDWGLR